jgi:hypothetical protein
MFWNNKKWLIVIDLLGAPETDAMKCEKRDERLSEKKSFPMHFSRFIWINFRTKTKVEDILKGYFVTHFFRFNVKILYQA